MGRTAFVAKEGWYVVRCTGDYAYLDLDGHAIINPNELHAQRFRALDNLSSLAFLAEGEHTLRAVYYDKEGPAEFNVEVRPVDTPDP